VLAQSVAGPALAAGDLVLIPQLPIMLVLLVIFVVFIFPFNALVFKPIFRALDERSSRITGARQRAESISADADDVLARYEESIREARTEAEIGRKGQVSEARTEQASIAAAARAQAEQKVEQARESLGRTLDDARRGLRAGSQDLARIAAEQILGRSIS